MTEYSDLVKKYGEFGNDSTNIAIGVRPSGIIHLGNISTLTLSGLLARDIGLHLTQVNVTVCDIDMPDRSEWPMKDSRFVRYFKDLPDKERCHSNILNHTRWNLESFLSGLEEELGVEFNINTLTEVQRDPGFRAGLKRMLDIPGIMKEIKPTIGDDDVLVFPLCGQCGTSNPYFTKYDGKVLHTECSNPSCSMGEYEMDVMDCTKDLAVHFFIDPMRDRTVEPFADVHVFGGDYRDEHMRSSLSKAQKIAKLTCAASPDGSSPDVLIGPKFYARDGNKMSKSRNNGLSLDVLKAHLGDDYVKSIVEFTRVVADEDYKHVDYPTIEQYLLSPK